MQEVMLNLYYLFFGVLLIIAQLQLQWMTRNFRFMNYHWGRCLFCIFLGSMSCTSSGEAFVQYIVAVYFFICAILFGMLSCCDRNHDLKRGDRDELDMLKQEQQEGQEN